MHISRSRLLGLKAAGVVLASLATGFVSSAVIASNWGSGALLSYAVSLADDRHHYVHTDYLPPSISGDFEYARDSIYGLSTDLQTYDGTPWQDVWAHSGSFGSTGSFGWVLCPATATTPGLHPNRTCYGQTLHLNAYYQFAYDTWQERVFQSCHELGHTVGLRDNPSYDPYSCMSQGNNSITVISLHDITHINAQY